MEALGHRAGRFLPPLTSVSIADTRDRLRPYLREIALDYAFLLTQLGIQV
jgi:hypothetical protein